ncbi:hypothetical protein AVEN_127543-1 [Araneus ventricosus]|uniref:Secreted protein n=1 Tax=Araneus ventricosus TaxID=182803 RepID=A0A4Y2WSR7_ARAVE|nr:hypothetical protein AVEN_127543-1 [Araneus ventricosus]
MTNFLSEGRAVSTASTLLLSLLSCPQVTTSTGFQGLGFQQSCSRVPAGLLPRCKRCFRVQADSRVHETSGVQAECFQVQAGPPSGVSVVKRGAPGSRRCHFLFQVGCTTRVPIPKVR